MTDLTTQELVEAVKKLVEQHPLKWEDVQGKRSVMYIPFTPEEDHADGVRMDRESFRSEVERDCDSQMLRTFGKGVQLMTHAGKMQDEVTKDNVMKLLNALPEKARKDILNKVTEDNVMKLFNALPEEARKEILIEVTKDNVMKLFNALPVKARMDILNEVVRKTPVIVQNWEGQDMRVLGLRAHDSVNVTGHGDKRNRDITTQVEGGTVRLAAAEVLKRMKEDLMAESLGNNVARVKLHCCGSGGELVNAFTEAAEEQQMNLEVYAYTHESVGYRAPECALDNLMARDRFVLGEANEKVVKEMGDLTQKLERMIKRQADHGGGEMSLDAMEARVQGEAQQAEQEAGVALREVGKEGTKYRVAALNADYKNGVVAEVEEIQEDLTKLTQKLETEVAELQAQFDQQRSSLEENQKLLGGFDDQTLVVEPDEYYLKCEENLKKGQAMLDRVQKAAQMPMQKMVDELKKVRRERHEISLEPAIDARRTFTVGEMLKAERVKNRQEVKKLELPPQVSVVPPLRVK